MAADKKAVVTVRRGNKEGGVTIEGVMQQDLQRYKGAGYVVVDEKPAKKSAANAEK